MALAEEGQVVEGKCVTARMREEIVDALELL
jgi:hypothetical protein